MKKQSGTKAQLICERLVQICAEHCSRAAVRFGDDVISYAELDARSSELATELTSAGVGVGDLVGICMARSQNMLISILGIWKSGAAFIPLDPDYPKTRLIQMIEDAPPKVILADRCRQKIAQFSNTKLLDFSAIVTGKIAPCPSVRVTSETLAYVIFTSGSTGRPKGVQVSHGALASFFQAIQRSLNVQPSDITAALTPLSFDISILELILPLLHGAMVALVDKKTAGDGKKLSEELESCGATIVQATPITWRLLLDSGWRGNKNLTVVCGGETMQRPLADELLRHCDRVFNAYGPTEATIWATIERVQSGVGQVPIGRALSTYKTLVVNEVGAFVSPGCIGQLFIGGSGLASGYINRPEETNRRFVTIGDKGQFYATGDLVREMPNGKLEFVGRADHQVKIHGFRVELGDIEAQLLGVSGIKEALVMLREDMPGNQKIVAYIIADGAETVSREHLRNVLKERLPSHMIPNHFVQMTSFPKTLNSKVDRKQFPAPDVAGHKASVATNDPLEAYLQSVWCAVLDISAIDISDDFFDLGGDSIQAARITNRVEEWLGELVWPVILFDAPTITEFADYLRKTYPKAVAKKDARIQTLASDTPDRVVDENLAKEFVALSPPLARSPRPTRKSPSAIFVLNPPRSGSTLLRVMLAGSPQLFAPPEIELLTFNTMKERAKTFSGRETYRLEGTIRAVMEIKNCDVATARTILKNYENDGTTVAEFYSVLQSLLDGRILVDKTPSNTLDPEALHRIEEYFEEPIYIHLTRHPLGMIRSFLEAKLSEVFFRRTPHSFSPRELAELIWLTSHRNTLIALSAVPAERQFRLSFEDLTHAPEDIMRRLCDFLAIECNPAMLKPWQNKKDKMADGLHTESKMMGDPKFHLHKIIDPNAANRWRDEMHGVRLGDLTRNLAQKLGYTDFGTDTNDDEREEFIL